MSEANGSHLFLKLHVLQIMLNFLVVEHMVTILCLWFRFTRPLKIALLKGFMICREAVYINLNLLNILRMALMNRPNEFRLAGK